MAQATRNEPESITMVLSPEEARALRDVLSHIGGCPFQSRRALTDRVNDALDRVGIQFTDARDIQSCIYILDPEEMA